MTFAILEKAATLFKAIKLEQASGLHPAFFDKDVPDENRRDATLDPAARKPSVGFENIC